MVYLTTLLVPQLLKAPITSNIRMVNQWWTIKDIEGRVLSLNLCKEIEDIRDLDRNMNRGPTEYEWVANYWAVTFGIKVKFYDHFFGYFGPVIGEICDELSNYQLVWKYRNCTISGLVILKVIFVVLETTAIMTYLVLKGMS